MVLTQCTVTIIRNTSVILPLNVHNKLSVCSSLAGRDVLTNDLRNLIYSNPSAWANALTLVTAASNPISQMCIQSRKHRHVTIKSITLKQKYVYEMFPTVSTLHVLFRKYEGNSCEMLSYLGWCSRPVNNWVYPCIKYTFLSRRQ